jgi:hypothetical protein
VVQAARAAGSVNQLVVAEHGRRRLADLMQRRLKHGAFASVDDAVAAIVSYLRHPTRLSA